MRHDDQLKVPVCYNLSVWCNRFVGHNHGDGVKSVRKSRPDSNVPVGGVPRDPTNGNPTEGTPHQREHLLLIIRNKKHTKVQYGFRHNMYSKGGSQ